MKTLNLVFAFALVFFVNAVKAQFCDGIFSFSTQSEVDQFIIDHPDCTSILGDVYIFNNEQQNDWISDLSAFSNITSISGDLNISQGGNASLAPMSFLGLSNLQSIGGEFQVDDLHSGTITNFDGLENLVSCSHLLFAQFAANTDISGLSGLQTVDILEIFSCDYIQFVDAFPSLHTVSSELTIYNGQEPYLQPVFSGFNALQNVGSSMMIGHTMNLPVSFEQFDAFHNLTDVLSISLQGIECNSFSGFQSLQTVLYLSFDVTANQYSNFDSLTSVPVRLDLNCIDTVANYGSFPSLVSCHGLNIQLLGDVAVSMPVLTEVTSFLSVGNDGVLDAPLLTSIAGDLHVLYSSVSNLNWLENLQTISGVIEITNNPNLSSCSVEALCQHIASDPGSMTIMGNLGGCNSVAEIAAGCQLSSASGIIYADVDCNGNLDNGDVLFGYKVVVDDANVPVGSGNVNGNYTVVVPDNSTISFHPTSQFGFITPASYSASNTGSLVNYPNMDFAFCPIPNFHNVSVSHIEMSHARPGDVLPVQVVVENLNAFNESGTVSLDISGIPGVLVGDNSGGVVSGSVVTWTYSDLSLFEVASFSVRLQMSTSASIGDVYALASTVTINGFADLDITNNSFSTEGYIVASYDPNEKAVNRPFINYDEVSATEQIPLVYTIHFQNTGMAEALTVRLEDTFEENLDMSTIEMISASHDYALSFDDNRKAIWTFENIHLADSATNLEGSIGYVQFRINAVAGLQSTDNIQNNASIFFDFNEAVVTNYATTEFYTCPENIQIIGDTEACEFSNVIFNVTDGWSSYFWSVDGLPSGANSLFAFWQVPAGEYVVDLQAHNAHCASADTIVLVVDPHPFTLTITQVGNVLSANTNNACIWTYEGNVLPINQSSITMQNSGNYSVYQLVGGCESNVTQGFYNVVGVEEVQAESAVKIYPNPTSGQTTFDFGVPIDGSSRMIIRDAIGREIANVAVISNQAIVDFGRFAPGLYSVVILRNGEMQGEVKRVVVE